MKKYIFTFLFLIVSITIYPQIPKTISYQGVLSDASGNLKPDGNYNFIFSLYDASASGDALWSESKTLNVTKGLFSTSLGDQTPFGANVRFDEPYWLGIKVGSDPELSPRIALTSSGYSITSGTSQDVINGKVVKSINGLKDDITITGGGGTTVNSSNNQIIISSSGSGGSGMQGIQNTDNTIEIINPNGPTATVNLKLPMSLNNNNSSYIFSSLNNGNGGSIYGYAAQGGYGVRGESPTGTGLLGISTSATGILGQSSTGTAINGSSISGRGLWGSSQSWQGVYGFSESQAGTVGESNSFDGIFGVSHSATSAGASGHNDAGGWGIYGDSPNGSGVVGNSNAWVGVYGHSNSNAGVNGESQNFDGVFGTSHSPSSAGVSGHNTAGGFALYGESTTGTSIWGVSEYGAVGGGLGWESSGAYCGVYGFGTGNNGKDYAGRFDGYTAVNGGLGVKLMCTVIGDLYVSGNKDFKIDHPLDPANKFLLHSCIESPDRMNIYNGNIVTDANGSATVELPSYFEALNIDYRYQLTVIGQFAQAIVESEISNNQFTIRTDKPNVKVSWQVTGIRNDAYAKEHPMVNEKEKAPNERGKYLMPELFGQPKEMGIYYEKPVSLVSHTNNKEPNNENK
jgi:hypothetical protein